MKKLLSFLLTIVLIACLAIPAFAVDVQPLSVAEKLASEYTLEERLMDAQLGFIDETVDSKYRTSVSVFAFDGERKMIDTNNECNVTYGVRNLGEIYENGEVIGTVYSLTAAQKTVSNSGTQSGVGAWLSLVWIDNLGTSNQLVSISGGWSPNGHTLSNRRVSYSVSDFFNTYYTSIGSRPTTDTFNIAVGATGYSFGAESEVSIDGSLSRFTLRVETSIWD